MGEGFNVDPSSMVKLLESDQFTASEKKKIKKLIMRSVDLSDKMMDTIETRLGL